MKTMKLYNVEIGCQDRKAGDVQNWMKRNVLAKDAAQAIKKMKLHGREYVVACSVIATLDQE